MSSPRYIEPDRQDPRPFNRAGDLRFVRFLGRIDTIACLFCIALLINYACYGPYDFNSATSTVLIAIGFQIPLSTFRLYYIRREAGQQNVLDSAFISPFWLSVVYSLILWAVICTLSWFSLDMSAAENRTLEASTHEWQKRALLTRVQTLLVGLIGAYTGLVHIFVYLCIDRL